MASQTTADDVIPIMSSQTTAGDWQQNKSVLESNRHMLEKQLYCDINFIFSGASSNKKEVKSYNKDFELYYWSLVIMTKDHSDQQP